MKKSVLAALVLGVTLCVTGCDDGKTSPQAD